MNPSLPPSVPSPVEILQRLIQFNTTNPPGYTDECMGYIQDLLTQAGIETQVFAKQPRQPNLLARLPGRGAAPPFLMYGHVDVVTTENQTWRYPPFSGQVADGFVWGRGALDMKGGIAMMLSALLWAKAEGYTPPGDILFLALSDEEAGGNLGARFMVEEHPQLFQGVRYAIGEFGGFTLTVGGKRFYPIQVAEKQICWLKATFRGPAGHGSMPIRGGAMARLAEFLLALDRHPLPVHITPTARDMLEGMAAAIGGVQGLVLRLLLKPRFTDRVLALLGDQGRIFGPLLHNTVSPTILHGSSKINVIPAEVAVELDGRLLPGFQPQDLIAEIRNVVGQETELEVLHFDPGPPKPDMGLFPLLGDILRHLDPEGIPIPLLLSGVTDARYFARLGIQTYGFLPMPLPPDFAFASTIHAADERIPVAALDFGTQAIYTLLQRLPRS